jgi:hypothetical protein
MDADQAAGALARGRHQAANDAASLREFWTA